MDAIALLFSKFSDELLGAQVALLFFVSTLAVYWLLIRNKKKQSAEWVPAALVRAYLDRVRDEERDIRFKLFGEASAVTQPATFTTVVAGTDANAAREIEALRAQLLQSDQRALEFDRMMNGLRSEKAALEQKLKEALAAPVGSVQSADTVALTKELGELKSKLDEYSVIEDDLANLKKFQKENETLKQKISQLEKGGAPALTVVAGGGTPAETSTKVAGVTENIQTPVTVISGGAAPASTAPANVAPVSAAPAASAAPAQVDTPVAAAASASNSEKNTNVLQSINPTVDSAAPALEKSAKQKEEELLSEFEKMLAS